MRHSLLRDGGQLLYDAFGALLFWLITIKCNHSLLSNAIRIQHNVQNAAQFVERGKGQLRRQNVLLVKDSQLGG